MKEQQKGILFCVAGAVCWGISGTCGQALFDDYGLSSLWVTAFRMIVAGCILMCITVFKEKKRCLEMWKDKNAILQMLVFSTVGLAYCQLAYLTAIKYTNAGTATVLQNLSIIIVAIITTITSRKMPSKRIMIAACMAFSGVWLIATGGKIGSMQLTMQGFIWGMGAAVGAVTYSMLSEKPVQKFGSISVTAWGLLLGGSVVSMMSRVWIIPENLDFYGWSLLMVVAIIGTVLSFNCFLRGISLIGPLKAMLIGCLEPVTATVLAFFWLGSTFTIPDLLGFALIMATVFVTTI